MSIGRLTVVYMPWWSVQVEKYSSFNVILFMVIVLR